MRPNEKLIARILCSHCLLQNQMQVRRCGIAPKPSDKPETDDMAKHTEIATQVSETSKVTKNDMKWRSPWHEKEGHRYSYLRSFYTEHTNTNLIKFMQTPIDLTPAGIKKWWTKRQETINIALEQYLPERNRMLGNELAAAHFIVHRGGAVKFFDEDVWIKADANNNYSLPKFYESEKILQAIDCSEMDLHYEGLENLRDLKKVEWLSFNDCKNIDDWCLDRISNMFSDILYLDVRNCPNVTHRGLGALYKMKELKILLVDIELCTKAVELTCLMLQELKPDLDIRPR